MKMLTILIPTRNRTNELNSLIFNLHQMIEQLSLMDEVEIIISDNSDSAISVDLHKNVKVIHTGGIYKTAEENLFSIIPLATGKYIWPLGDDEIPIFVGFEKMVNLCRSQKYDVMTWNSQVIGIEGEPLGHSRISMNVDELQLSFNNFVERTGYWSIAAGISLTVFKNELNNFEYLSEIMELGSPIYSHVSYYMGIFHNKNFAFINQDLVCYQTNRHDVIASKNNHWKNHADKAGYFYRYPWTLGMIIQLKFLETKGIIKSSFFDNILDISHFGRRFKLAENMIAMLIEQRILELENIVKLKMNDHQVQKIVEYLRIHVPRYARTYELILSTLDQKTRSSRKRALLSLNNHRNFLNQSWTRLPFHGFYRYTKSNLLYFETPLGWIAVKPNLINVGSEYVENATPAAELLCKNLSDSLIYALNGLEIPQGFNFHANTPTELDELIKVKHNDKEINQPLANAFFLAPEKYAGKVYQDASRARMIWNKLPLFVRKFLKKHLFG
jgi:hypothetical protein